MRITLSVIKADVGSIAGHVQPSKRIVEAVRALIEPADFILDQHVTWTGDDIAILMTHTRGVGDEYVHTLAWEAFRDAAEIAREQGRCAAGQELLRVGPAVAELTFEERQGESLLLFAADKTDPGAFNLPLYLAFADPLNTPGLILSPDLGQGFRFTIMDVAHTAGDRVIELDAPEELYDIAALLRDPGRFVVESVRSRATGEIAAVASTSRLHDIAGRYTGKDDPLLLVRVQKDFPTTGEILAPFATGHFVAGGMRGSQQMPLMPVEQCSPVSYFDGPPIVSCAGFCLHEGKLTEAVDAFAHPFWDEVRARVSQKALEMRRQGFFGAAMLPMAELEYTGIVERLRRIEGRFRTRKTLPRLLVGV